MGGNGGPSRGPRDHLGRRRARRDPRRDPPRRRLPGSGGRPRSSSRPSWYPSPPPRQPPWPAWRASICPVGPGVELVEGVETLLERRVHGALASPLGGRPSRRRPDGVGHAVVEVVLVAPAAVVDLWRLFHGGGVGAEFEVGGLRVVRGGGGGGGGGGRLRPGPPGRSFRARDRSRGRRGRDRRGRRPRRGRPRSECRGLGARPGTRPFARSSRRTRRGTISWSTRSSTAGPSVGAFSEPPRKPRDGEGDEVLPPRG